MPVTKKSNEPIKFFHQVAHLRHLPNAEEEKDKSENPRRGLLSNDGQQRSGLIHVQENPVEPKQKRNNTVVHPKEYPVKPPRLQKK